MAEIKVTVFKAEQYDEDWIPGNLLLARLWLTEKLESIPAKHRAGATIEIDAHSRYGGESTLASIEIAYRREQTAEEIEQEAANSKNWREEQIRWLESQLAKMKAPGNG